MESHAIRELLLDLVERAAPMLLPDTQVSVVDCLMAPEVGATHPSLFKCINETDIPVTIAGALPRRAIVRALHEYDAGQNRITAPPPAKRARHSNGAGPSGVRPNNLRSVAELTTYTFSVEWDKLDKTLLARMDLANKEEREANAKDKDTLKNDIALLMKSSYVSHCANFPQKFKTPGMPYYRKVRDEVFVRFEHCLKDYILGEPSADGKETWVKLFRQCVENKLRDNDHVDTGRQKKAVVADGQVEARLEEYHPHIPDEHRPALEKRRDALQEMAKRRRSDLNLNLIQKEMHETYDLQRDDIINAKDEIDTQMATILELWPFLFKQPWLGNHFQKLTGQILDQALYGWRETHAQSFMLYLCSSATAATEEAMISNVAERLRWENDGRKSTSMMLLILKMISNHFHEANGFKTLILTKEKTTLELEVKEDLTEIDPQIVAMDTDMYLAEKFLVCMGKEVLMQASSFDEALINYVQLLFTFDANYPSKLQATMEFFERIVFHLGRDISKLNSKKSGKEIYVLTPNVAKMVNKVKTFREKLNEQLGAK